MKKLSVLMASLMCLTVGGVYAAWSYAESAVAPAEADKGIQLEGYVDTKNAPGMYTLTPNVNTANEVNNKDMFYFDSNLQVNSDLEDPHKVILVTNCSLEITFTPNQVATNEVKANGIATTVSFVFGKDIASLIFDGEEVFTNADLNTLEISGVGEDTDASDKKVNWTRNETPEGDITFTYTITQEQLIALLGIEVNPELRLENSTEHAAFSSLITGLTIKTTVAKKA